MQRDNNKKYIENIYSDSTLMAIILRTEYKIDGINFLTPSNFSQQLGYMSREKGYKIKPHVHNPVNRTIAYTQEVLFIKSGKLRVDFYSQEMLYLESRILLKGDLVLLACGGHGFEIIEPCEIIEVKQGPFAGEADKTRFESIKKEDINLI